MSFFFVARTTLLEEVAKFRAARRIWARIMREDFNAKDPKSQALRFHTQTAGVQLTAQQPEVNLVRVALQGLGAVLGGTQSLHTNAFDEAIALPDGEGGPARPAYPAGHRLRERRDQDRRPVRRVLRHGVAHRRPRSRRPRAHGDRVEAKGGAVAAIEEGFQKSEIERSAYAVDQQIDSGERTVVGLNRFRLDEEDAYEPLRVDPQIEADQRERLAQRRTTRDNGAVERALDGLRAAAKGTDNALPPMREALAAKATVGEVCHALREVWGTYVPRDTF